MSEKRSRDYTSLFVAAVLVGLAVLVFGLLLMSSAFYAGDAAAYPAKVPHIVGVYSGAIPLA